MMKKWFLNLILMIFLLFIAGCSGQGSESKSMDMAAPQPEMARTDIREENVMVDRPVEAKDAVAGNDIGESMNHDRMFIYHANLSIEVKDYYAVAADIQQKATELGGYIVESTTYDHDSESITGTIILKVPQSYFQSYLTEIEKKSIKVVQKSITGNDVSEEFVDLESRLKAKEAVENRLLTLMEQATKTEDLLKISNDLSRVQEEKEQIQGRMKYLKNNVDYSTVTIYLEEQLVKIDSIKGNDSLNTWQKGKSLFVDTINGIISVFSGVVVLLVGLSPIIVPIVIIFVLWIVYRKRKRKE